MWPQVITGIVVSICSAIVTMLVQKATKKLENVATKDFVSEQLSSHGDKLKTEIGDMFVRASTQSVFNSDVEARLRRVEDAFGVRLRDIVKPQGGLG